MPAYDYRCENCHTIFLVDLSYADLKNEELKVICPNCGSDDTTRLVNKGVSVVFKGKGFYNTDKNKEIEDE